MAATRKMMWLWICGYIIVFAAATLSETPGLRVTGTGVPWFASMVGTPVLHFTWFPQHAARGFWLSAGLVAAWLAGAALSYAWFH